MPLPGEKKPKPDKPKPKPKAAADASKTETQEEDDDMDTFPSLHLTVGVEIDPFFTQTGLLTQVRHMCCADTHISKCAVRVLFVAVSLASCHGMHTAACPCTCTRCSDTTTRVSELSCIRVDTG